MARCGHIQCKLALAQASILYRITKKNNYQNPASEPKGSSLAQNWTSDTYNGPFAPQQASTLQGNHKKKNKNLASEPKGSSLVQNWTSDTYNVEMWPHPRQACANAGLDPSENHKKKTKPRLRTQGLFTGPKLNIWYLQWPLCANAGLDPSGNHRKKNKT